LIESHDSMIEYHSILIESHNSMIEYHTILIESHITCVVYVQLIEYRKTFLESILFFRIEYNIKTVSYDFVKNLLSF